MEPIVGIDLGTTNSVVAIVQNGVPRVIKDPDTGESVLPSVVGVDADGKLLVGQQALNQAALYPERTIRSVKRKMGQDVNVSLGEREMSPPEISALILGRLRQWAEKDLGCAVNKAVITVPAYFDDTQREATRLAGQLAGLEVARIINEPTAAALVYDPENNDAQRILVYDLGGGTFDVSIVALESGVVEVLATHGDTALGGDDFDALIGQQLLESTGALKSTVEANAAAMARLSLSAEAAKRRLSFDTFTIVAEEFLISGDPTSNLETTLERKDYETLIKRLLEKTIVCVDAALADANMSASQLDRVILVGGSTRTPRVYDILHDRLNHEPSSEIDPDLCVALGAAVQGAVIAGEQVHRVLVDITPHTLGIRCADPDRPFAPADVFSPIIHRGTALPCKRADTFFTCTHGQSMVEVEVYQGESDNVMNNHFIGSVTLGDLDRDAPANSPVSVSFQLNLNGMLEVRAVDRRAGKEVSTELKRPSESEFANRVLENAESASQISQLLNRDDQIVATQSVQIGAGSEKLKNRLKEVLAKVTEVQAAIGDQDADEIATLTKELARLVDADDADQFETTASELDDLLFYLNES